MDQIVMDRYRDLYEGAPDPFALKPSINEMGTEIRQGLRPDAAYLLLVNFSALVIAPAVETNRVPVEQFRNAAINDIRVIVRTASNASNTDQISGHQVINALSNVWGDLKTMAYNVWD